MIDTGIIETKKVHSKKVDVLIEERTEYCKAGTKRNLAAIWFDFYTTVPHSNVVWVIDVKHAIRQVQPWGKYKEYFDDLLNWMIPDDPLYTPRKLVIAIYNYLQ